MGARALDLPLLPPRRRLPRQALPPDRPDRLAPKVNTAVGRQIREAQQGRATEEGLEMTADPLRGRGGAAGGSDARWPAQQSIWGRV